MFWAGPSSSAHAKCNQVVTADPWAATHFPRAAQFIFIPPNKVQKRAAALGVCFRPEESTSPSTELTEPGCGPSWLG